MIDLVKEAIKGFIPYDTNQVPYRIKLDANESPFDLSDRVKAALSRYIEDGQSIKLYPDTNSHDLRRGLADKYGMKPENFLVGTGSDQIIQIIINTFIEKGDRVICPVPSFAMYKLTTIISGGVPIEVSLNQDFNYDIQEFLRVAKENKAKIVFLCTPNNPTGNTLSKEEVIQVLEATAKKSVIVVDEAYFEFDGETVADLIDKYENLIVLRTFSKAYGLAGLRVGYSIANESINKILNKAKPPYNLSSFSQKAAELVLKDEKSNQRNISFIKEQREWLANSLMTVEGIQVFPSRANFILIKIQKAEQINKQLENRGILVRGFGDGFMLKDCIRVTVGFESENRLFIEELKKAVEEVI